LSSTSGPTPRASGTPHACRGAAEATNWAVTIYTTSNAKVAEHGGLAADDTHVALLVVNGQRGLGQGAQGRVIGANIDTTQIAPTILQALGLDPSQLDAVRLEHTPPLPGLGS
jgi:hypothetical protein